MNIIELTSTLSDDDLIEVWCSLNTFSWPKCWPDERRPNWWTNDLFSERKQGFISPFMEYCREKIGMEMILIEWRKRHRILPAEMAST